MSAYQCISCGVHFVQMVDYYRHRVVGEVATTCVPQEQMHQLSIKVDPNTRVFREEDYFTAPCPRKRVTVPARPQTPENLARWYLRQGIEPDRIVKAGVSTRDVLKALDAHRRDA